MKTHLPHIQLKQLRQLIVIAENGSIRKAAEELSIAQPALSRSLRALENGLQVKLMNRGPRGIELTEYGTTLVEYARIIETNLRFASEEIEELRGAREGHVRLGVGRFEGSSVVPLAVNRLLSQRPNAEIAVVEGDFTMLSADLIAGELDMILGPSDPNSSALGLNSMVLAMARPVVAVRSEHPLAKRNDVSFSELAEQDWVMPFKGHRARVRLENIFIRQGLTPPRTPIECMPTATAAAILQARNLISLMPRQLVQREIEHGTIKVLPVETDEFTLTVQLTTREFDRLSPACRDMIAYIKEVCAEVADTL